MKGMFTEMSLIWSRVQANSGGEIFCTCARLWRVRCLDGKPLILDINLFRKALVPGLTAEIAKRSIYAYIEKELGMQIATSKRTITVEYATAQDAQLLELGNYNCLAIVRSQTFNSNGILFEYTQSRHQPDHFSFHDTAIRK